MLKNAYAQLLLDYYLMIVLTLMEDKTTITITVKPDVQLGLQELQQF